MPGLGSIVGQSSSFFNDRGGWSGCLRNCDLRFIDDDEELSFKRSLEDRLVFRGIILFSCELLAHLATICLIIGHNHGKEKTLEYTLSDPRFLTSVTSFVEACLCATLITVCVLHLYFHRLKFVDWEVFLVASFQVIMLAYTFGNQFAAASLTGVDSNLFFGYGMIESEQLLVQATVAKVTAVLMLLPARTLLLFPFMTLSALSTVIVTFAIGAGSSWLRGWKVVLLAVSLAASAVGCYSKEDSHRSRWLAERKSEFLDNELKNQSALLLESNALTAGLRAVANKFCDLVLFLDSTGRVLSEKRIDAFFGQKMDGMLLTETMNDNDASRFQELLSGAVDSFLPKCGIVTVNRLSRATELQLLVVDTRNDRQRYLIGVSALCEDMPQPRRVSDDASAVIPNCTSTPEACEEKRNHPLVDAESEISFIYSLTTAKEAKLRAHDRGVQTSIKWETDGFTCTNCARPPTPKQTNNRELAALRRMTENYERKTLIGRKSSTWGDGSSEDDSQSISASRTWLHRDRLFMMNPSLAREYDGLYRCVDEWSRIGTWLKLLLVRDGEVVDADGVVSHLKLDRGRVLFSGAELQVTASGELLRFGKSGSTLRYKHLAPEILEQFLEREGLIGASSLPSSTKFVPALAAWIGETAGERAIVAAGISTGHVVESDQ